MVEFKNIFDAWDAYCDSFTTTNDVYEFIRLVGEDEHVFDTCCEIISLHAAKALGAHNETEIELLYDELKERIDMVSVNK